MMGGKRRVFVSELPNDCVAYHVLCQFILVMPIYL